MRHRKELLETVDMASTKESVEMIKDLGSKGYETTRQLGEINQQTMEILMSRQMDAMNMMMETSLRQVNSLVQAKGYKELLEGQVEFAKEIGERMLELSRENVQIAKERGNEYRAWFDGGVEAAAEKFSSMQKAV
jgi:phasin family protein